MKIEYPGLIPNTDASLKTLVRLMNPATVEETKYICDFITTSLNLRFEMLIISYHFISHCIVTVLCIVNMFWRTPSVMSVF